jgi:L-alanine-DL-glutamate epimerase-like enolase superfamily enzyme
LAEIKAKIRKWPIAGSFRIAHGTLTEIEVVEVRVSKNEFFGRGECRPYARYDETPESVIDEINSVTSQLSKNPDLELLQTLLPAGAARNALDCALWDLKAKSKNKRIWELLKIPAPMPRMTAFTLSIDTPEKMARAANASSQYPILKLKIDGLRGLEACLAVMRARPDAQLIIDANESLSPTDLKQFRNALSGYPVLMIEQPLKASEFEQIDNSPHQLPILCADESLHTTADLQKLWDAGYRAVNVKLDKCGGVSEALTLITTAKQMGFVVMAGCMVGTSLAMAPIMALSSYADVLDLDGPLLLKKDIGYGLKYDGPIIYPHTKKLWG